TEVTKMIDEAARAYIMEVARAYFALKNLARLPWSVSKQTKEWLRLISEPFPSYHRSSSPSLLCFNPQVFSSRYGPLLHLRILNVPIVLVSSASVAHEIFKDHDMSVFSHGAIGIDECLVFGAFGFIKAPYGDYWKFMKKLITTNMLGPQALERSRDVRSFEIERFYRSLLEKSMKKHSVEIGEEALRLVNNFLGKFEELLEKIIMKYEEKVEEQRQGSEIMDALLEAYRDQKAEYKITKNHIEVLLAVTPLQKQYSGLWTMAEIINNRKILKRLREEIDSVRLYFQGNLNKGVKIGRFYIPKATFLVINVHAVMRDPDSWKDPDEFKPERGRKREKILNFLPFGAGRRGCPGSNLGYILVGAAIGVMVQCFDWVIEGEKVNMEEASGKAFCLWLILLTAFLFLIINL
ncbi:LOW QUALITY PROTEIN: hypothetical protein HID58_076655, partial [Brassica napus]